MSEHVGGTKILTGSTAIDMVKRIPIHEAGPKKYILLTLHRRENIETDRAAAYLKALCAFLNQHNDPEDRITCMWITHPNPKVQALVKNIDQPANMGISEAAEYTRFIQYAQHAWAICSDSGGIQEENTVLRCPLFILRDSTERPEVLTSKNVKLVQKSEMLETLLQELYDKPETYTVTGENKMFGSGDAGERIVNFIEGLGR
jgi:UDP-N-acetylglucosamine 2-epimerase (non-hydrolysing)